MQIELKLYLIALQTLQHDFMMKEDNCKILVMYYIIAPFFNCWAVVPTKIKDISMTTYCHWQ